ncbi:MAG: DUF1573 domain-containing protein [Marinilabilia sp.]
MKRLLGLAIVAFIGVAAYGQQSRAAIEFEKKTHDFGEIKEDEGTVEHTFKFTNTGEQPLVVHNVRASCGCTSPDWTRRPVKPGKEGNIKVVFDPKNRPGNFNKSIVVRTNGEESSVVLRITGKVEPRERTVEDHYPKAMGDIRLKSAHLSFTKIAPDEKKTEELEMINTSEEVVGIEFDNVPSHLQIRSEPEELKPGEEGKIVATFDAEAKDDWGFVVDQVYLKMNGELDRKNRLSVNATIEEDFSEWSEEEMANAPEIEVDDRVFDFGGIKQGEKVSHAFKLSNTGKSDLVLRKIRASCGCTAIEPEETVIPPGESTKVVAEFDARGMSGRQNKSVTIYSNDPHKSKLLLRLTGTVEK